jgi:hypothetical protein
MLSESTPNPREGITNLNEPLHVSYIIDIWNFTPFCSCHGFDLLTCSESEFTYETVNLFRCWYDCLHGGSAEPNVSSLPTQGNAREESDADVHSCPERDSNLRFQCSREPRISCYRDRNLAFIKVTFLYSCLRILCIFKSL